MKDKPVSKAGKRTLVVLSHGYGAPNVQSTGLMEHLASHGFILVSPTHTGNELKAAHGDDFDVASANHSHFVNFCAMGNYLIDHFIGMALWNMIGAADLTQPYKDSCTPEAFPIAKAEGLQSLYVTAFFKRQLQGMIEYDRYLTEEYARDNEPDVRFFRKHGNHTKPQ